MMSLATIEQMNREAAELAVENGIKPFVFYDDDELEHTPPFPFPFVGDAEFEGWDHVNDHFVDSSGFGEPGEPAYTADEFKRLVGRRIHDNAERGLATGWALTSVGQFQVYVGEFTRRVR